MSSMLVSRARRAAVSAVALALCGVLAGSVLAPTVAAPGASHGPARAAAAAGLRLGGAPLAGRLEPGPPEPGPLDARGSRADRAGRTDPRVTAWVAASGDPESVLVVVNKRRPLRPAGFVPADLRGDSGVLLRAEASDAFRALAAAADAAGVPVRARSGYRSFADQQVTYRRWQRELGAVVADRQSARPGHSEHQTGLAVDVIPRGGSCQDYGCFGATPQAAWLAEHAPEFGWVVRYRDGEEPVTGYTAEPWHLRFVGVPAARALAASGAGSIEEYLGLPPAPTY